LNTYFLDSSALLKRYHVEIGSKWLRRITAPRFGYRLYIAQITRVEVASAFARLKREGTLPARLARLARTLVKEHSNSQYRIIILDDEIIERAENLTDSYPLRAADAIQLACAIYADVRVKAATADPLIFLSADTRLLTAANAEGLLTDNPNAHP
jgi:uncharacterized protein